MKNLSLYYKPECPFCKKVLKVINDFQITSINLLDINKDEQVKNDLVTLGGKGTVPCLKIESNDYTQWMYQSEDICSYLNQNFVLDEHPLNLTSDTHSKYTNMLNALAEESGINSLLIMASVKNKMVVAARNKQTAFKVGGETLKTTDTAQKDNHKPYCEQVVDSGEPLFIADASANEMWKDNPDLVESGLGVYLGFPVKKDGVVVGTVCALHNESIDFKGGENPLYNKIESIKNSLENAIRNPAFA